MTIAVDLGRKATNKKQEMARSKKGLRWHMKMQIDKFESTNLANHMI